MLIVVSVFIKILMILSCIVHVLDRLDHVLIVASVFIKILKILSCIIHVLAVFVPLVSEPAFNDQLRILLDLIKYF